MRDFTYISDITAGVLAAMDHTPASGTTASYEIFNLGNSNPERVTSLITLLERNLGRKARVKKMSGMPLGDVSGTWANVTLANTELNWQPSTSLAAGIAKFSEWCAFH